MPETSNPRIYEIWREKLPAILNNPFSGTLHTVCVSENWFAVIQSLIGELERREAWVGSDEEIDTTIQYVLRIEAGADCREIVVERVETVRVVEFRGGGIGAEGEEDMACVTCIKRIRINDAGLLEVSYYTEVECADCWIVIGNTPVADIFSTVKNALLDSSNRARESAKIAFGRAAVNKNQEILRNCAKATALYDAVAAAAKAAVGINNTWYSLGNDVGDWIAKIVPVDVLKAAAIALLPELFVPVFLFNELIEAVSGMSVAELNELEAAQWESLRETTICVLSSQMLKAEELTSEELVNALTTIASRLAVGFEVLARLTNSFDFLAFRQLVKNTSDNLDCGCGGLVAGQTGVPTKPSGADYTWSKVLDFVADDHMPEIVTIISEPEGLQGVYVPEYGYRDVWTSAAGGDWRRLRINVDMAQSVYITSIDVHGEYTRGLLRENSPGSPLSNINQNIYFGGSVQRFTNTPETGVLRWTGLAQVDQFQVNVTIGYDEVDGGSGDPGGSARFTKIVIRGLGTVPAALSSLPDEE